MNIVETGKPTGPGWRHVRPPAPVEVDLRALFRLPPHRLLAPVVGGLELRRTVVGRLSTSGQAGEGDWWGLVTLDQQAQHPAPRWRGAARRAAAPAASSPFNQRVEHQDDDLVFVRPGSAPRRPRHVLDPFHRLTADAGLPRVRLPDLCHLAATLMLTSGVPLALTPATLRHSHVGTTANLDGHLTQEAAHAAADGLGAPSMQPPQTSSDDRWAP